MRKGNTRNICESNYLSIKERLKTDPLRKGLWKLPSDEENYLHRLKDCIFHLSQKKRKIANSCLQEKKRENLASLIFSVIVIKVIEKYKMTNKYPSKIKSYMRD